MLAKHHKATKHGKITYVLGSALKSSPFESKLFRSQNIRLSQAATRTDPPQIKIPGIYVIEAQGKIRPKK